MVPAHQMSLIFDTDIVFTREAIMVAGYHMTDPTDYVTCLSIISRDYVRIEFVIADLN